MPGYEEFYGTFLPSMGSGYGLATPWGSFLAPNGGRHFFVHKDGPPAGCPSFITENISTTLSAALRKCTADRGDTVHVLPGHTENVADALMLYYLVNGTRIVGHGQGSKMPAFRWTATGSQWALDNNDVLISGLRLRMEGANGVVQAVAVTGADCIIEGCEIEIASGATAKATIAIGLATGADRFVFVGNEVYGTATHNATDVLLIANAPDRVKVLKNVMQASATAGNGLVHFTGAATHLYVADNDIANTHTSSTGCIVLASATSTGMICRNNCSTLNNGTATAQGIILGANSLVRCFQNYSCDEPILSGILTPGACT